MCAEALPWHCHRSLIADAEIARGMIVKDIMNKTEAKPHKLTSFACIDKKSRPIKVYYPCVEDNVQYELRFTKD